MHTQTQTTAQHAPGPWTTHDTTFAGPAKQNFAIIDATKCEVCQVPATWNRPAEANARLIAAAPELLEALRCVVAALHQPVQTSDLTGAAVGRLSGCVQILRGDAVFAVNTAQSAIAKATGNV